jgi:hypothetical protein
MGVSTHTIKVDADIEEVEAKLQRCIELAERFKELWGDAPLPHGIERFAVSKGDHVVFRYDGPLSAPEVEKIRAQIKLVMPEIEPVLLLGGLRLEGVIAAGGVPFFDTSAPKMVIVPLPAPPADSEIRG